MEMMGAMFRDFRLSSPGPSPPRHTGFASRNRFPWWRSFHRKGTGRHFRSPLMPPAARFETPALHAAGVSAYGVIVGTSLDLGPFNALATILRGRSDSHFEVRYFPVIELESDSAIFVAWWTFSIITTQPIRKPHQHSWNGAFPPGETGRLFRPSGA